MPNVSFRRLRFLRLLILPLLFFYSFTIFGQSKNDSVKSQPLLTVKNGASIYSVDESFNEQIISKSVVAEGITKVRKKGTVDQSVTIESVPNASKPKKAVQSALENAKKLQEKESQKKVKKHLDKIVKAKNKIVFINSDATSSCGNHAQQKEYVAVSPNSFDHHEVGLYQPYFRVVKRLDFLDANKNFLFNSLSLGFSITDFISVRPPPAI